jgi:uncharacterized protein YndB with AHSA1/START domain
MTTATNESAARSKVTTPSDREIRVERIFDAPRERVWKAYTEPELVRQWWGRGNKLVIEKMEVERGVALVHSSLHSRLKHTIAVLSRME